MNTKRMKSAALLLCILGTFACVTGGALSTAKSEAPAMFGAFAFLGTYAVGLTLFVAARMRQ